MRTQLRQVGRIDRVDKVRAVGRDGATAPPVLATQPLPMLLVAAIFVIMGIAVDDIFVFVDMFRQCMSHDLDERVAHTMHTAVRATFFTSATSAVSFGVNALSRIPALRDFGVVTALLVITNYLMVSTFMFAGLCLWFR